MIIKKNNSQKKTLKLPKKSHNDPHISARPHPTFFRQRVGEHGLTH